MIKCHEDEELGCRPFCCTCKHWDKETKYCGQYKHTTDSFGSCEEFYCENVKDEEVSD